MVKIYQQPFAHSGTKQVIPDASDPQGFVSNTDGFTTDYELPDTDPNYKPIERAEFNGLMNMVTEAVGEIQQFGFAKWQPITWPQGARVVEGGVVYRALTQTSQQPPHADWADDMGGLVKLSGNQTIAGIKTFSSFPVMPSAAPTGQYQAVNKKYVDDALFLQPSMTGSIALNGTTNNTVVMTNIVTALGLETGDVIRINTGAYNKLHTVESITNNGSIIVNYEHAGNRGDGSLKLPNFTGQATVTRIAKWFNAQIGMGQGWVNMMASRSANVVYTNNTDKPIMVAITLTNTGSVLNSIQVSGDGIAWVTVGSGNANVNHTSSQFIVPMGWQYKSTPFANWSELR